MSEHLLCTHENVNAVAIKKAEQGIARQERERVAAEAAARQVSREAAERNNTPLPLPLPPRTPKGPGTPGSGPRGRRRLGSTGKVGFRSQLFALVGTL